MNDAIVAKRDSGVVYAISAKQFAEELQPVLAGIAEGKPFEWKPRWTFSDKEWKVVYPESPRDTDDFKFVPERMYRLHLIPLEQLRLHSTSKDFPSFIAMMNCNILASALRNLVSKWEDDAIETPELIAEMTCYLNALEIGLKDAQ